MKNYRFLAIAAFSLCALSPSAFAQDVPSTTRVITTSMINNALIGSGRLGIGMIGILGNNEIGSVRGGLSFNKSDAVMTLDALRYKAPIGAMRGEVSVGVYLSTNDISLKNGRFGPQINYNMGRSFAGFAYVSSGGNNKGQFIIGHRL